jgi:hypothetical protein
MLSRNCESIPGPKWPTENLLPKMKTKDFVSILKTLPDWELDEFRRIVTNGGLTEADDDRTIDLIRLHYGGDGVASRVTAIPPSDREYEQLLDNKSLITIAGLKVGAGCGALQKGTALPIDGQIGVQLYIGGNGSGKSSYVRIFRALGRSRVRPTLLPNIYGINSTSATSTATVLVQESDNLEELEWRSDINQNTSLGSISVYDAECGGVYLASGTVAEATPSGLAVFQALAEARKRIKATLQEYEARNSLEMNSLVPDDISHWRIDQFSQRDSSSPLSHINWTPADERRLAELYSLQRSHEKVRSDIAGHLERISVTRNLVSKLDRLVIDIDRIHDLIVLAMGADVTKAIEALSAFNASAQVPQSSIDVHHEIPDPTKIRLAISMLASIIHAINADAELVTQAKFSDLFPHTSTGHCALCNQELSNSAAARLRSLSEVVRRTLEESTVVNDIHKNETVVTIAIDHSLEIIFALKNMILSDVNNDIQTSGMDMLRELDNHIENLRNRCAQPSMETSFRQFISKFEESTKSKLDKQRIVLANLERFSQALGDYFDDSELSSLRTKLWISQNVKNAERVFRLSRENYWISSAKDQLGVSSLTAISKKIASDLVTENLANHMANEMAMLGMHDIRVQVASSSRGGVTTLRLVPSTSKKTELGHIFSDGEKGLMSFALFLAELKNSKHVGPIILDDPCVAMDDSNIKKVVGRIVEIGKHQQVLIFTHSERFRMELKSACVDSDTYCREREILAVDGSVGIVIE